MIKFYKREKCCPEGQRFSDVYEVRIECCLLQFIANSANGYILACQSRRAV